MAACWHSLQATCTLLAALFCVCVCKQANIVLLLTDDQDLLLGGMTPMAFTHSFMQGGGANLSNFFVNTPVCCPSRTTLLSGNYPHNWHITHGHSCMHMNVTNPAFEQSTIGVHMKALNYTTGMFGKLLNPDGMTPYCEGSALQPLPGFDTWLAMCNDNRYFRNTFTKDGIIYTSGTSPEDYLTSLIGNATMKFVEGALNDQKPFFAYVAPHAPHVPATPAPWYENKFSGGKAPRTRNYNYSALDHHYVVRMQPPITPKQAPEIDNLFQNRWRTLLSVDDIMIALVNLLQKYDELDNTYFITTSDHGFQLGQFRLPSCKLQPYEHDIRVPFYIRGPGIPANSTLSFVAGMVDVAPTLLSLAGGQPTDSMDGKSFANLLKLQESTTKPETAAAWSDKHTIEYWSLGTVIRYEHYIDLPNNTYIGVRLLNATHNYLYVEFYDGENVVSFDTPLEYELFDIGKDPYQMTNLYGTPQEDKQLVQELHLFLHKQIKCKGQECQ